jgi:hypothetical protein
MSAATTHPPAGAKPPEIPPFRTDVPEAVLVELRRIRVTS